MKRIFYFLVTNLAIMLVLSVTMSLLGVQPYLTASGLDLGNLLIFSLIIGFGGSFLSLALSKWSAKRMSGAVVIKNPTTPTPASKRRSTLPLFLASSSSFLLKFTLPNSTPNSKRATPPPAEAAVWMRLRPTMPRGFSTCPPKRGSIIC